MGNDKLNLVTNVIIEHPCCFPIFHVIKSGKITKCLPSLLCDHFSFDRINLIANNV